MPWVKLDEGFPQHPKVAQVGPLGVALQVAALCYCNRYLTDGFVPYSAVRTLLDFSGLGEDIGGDAEAWVEVGPMTIADRLVQAGMWEEVDGGYQIHDYGEYQPSREKVEADRLAMHEAKVAGGKARAAGAKRQGGRFVSSQVSTSTTSRPPAEDQQEDQHGTSPVPVTLLSTYRGAEDAPARAREASVENPSTTSRQPRRAKLVEPEPIGEAVTAIAGGRRPPPPAADQRRWREEHDKRVRAQQLIAQDAAAEDGGS